MGILEVASVLVPSASAVEPFALVPSASAVGILAVEEPFAVGSLVVVGSLVEVA